MSEPLLACLPADLRAGAVLTKIAVGLSGAGVYRVEASGQVYVLKVATEPIAAWQRATEIQAAAGEAGIAPRVIHVDPVHRAVVTTFIADRSFPARFFNPATRATALGELAETLRTAHALAIPAGAEHRDPRDVLAQVWPQLTAFSLPSFARAAIERALAEEPPHNDRGLVLSHNDVNPQNLVWDGERVRLFDWDMAGPNDPLYDLACIAVFLRMDKAMCAQLIATHDAAPIAPLPARFLYNRRLMSAFIGTVFMRIARDGGHPGAADGSPTTLVDTYQAMREGRLNPGTPEGQWAMGLAMLSTSTTL